MKKIILILSILAVQLANSSEIKEKWETTGYNESKRNLELWNNSYKVHTTEFDPKSVAISTHDSTALILGSIEELYKDMLMKFDSLQSQIEYLKKANQ